MLQRCKEGGCLKENNCKLLINGRLMSGSDHLLTQEMRALECRRAHNFSACVTSEELKQTRWRNGGSAEKGQGQRGSWEKENARRGPLVLKDGRGSKAGASPVTTSWVTEHDPLHLEPISQFLTTS